MDVQQGPLMAIAATQFTTVNLRCWGKADMTRPLLIQKPTYKLQS
jgi:hypothetical protein